MSLYRTYRPQTFKEVTGQHHVVTPVRHQLETGTVAHAYLFSGPRGIGKTTIARLIAKAVNCTTAKSVEPCGTCDACTSIQQGAAMDVIEIDAASHTGVDNVRDNIIENVRFAPTQLKKKVFIIDEVHMLSKGAFNALLKTIEEPPAYVTFVLATTELHKIPETIISRCQRFDFTNVPAELVVERLSVIAKGEGMDVETPVLEEIARRSGGHVRDAISLLEQVLTLDSKKITAEMARVVMPVVDVSQTFEFLRLLVARDAERAIRFVNQMLDGGVEPLRVAGEAAQLLRLALLQRIGGGEDKAYTHEQQAELKEMFAEADIARITTLLETFLETQKIYKSYPYHIPQLGLELAVIRICGEPVTAPTAPAQITVNVEPVTVTTAPKAPTPPPVEPVAIKADPKAETKTKGSVTIEQVRKYWTTFQRTLRERHASLPLALEQAEPVRVDDGKAIIKVQFEFYAETVNQPKNNSFLATILTEVVGENIGIQGMFSNVDTEPEVASVLEAFGGTVVG